MVQAMNKKNRQQTVEKVTEDKRFSHVQSDPRFIRPKKGDTKVKVDKRFAHMVKDKDFTETTKVDRYGQLQEDNRAETYLRNAYDFEESESESGSESSSSSEGEEEESEEDEETVVDRARGRGVDSDESSDEEFDSEISDVEWGQQDGGLSDVEEDPQDIPRGEETKRFACVNMDWVNVRAVDLLAVLTAFKPDGGSVLSVKIYPSQFGKERMSKEAVEGPPQDIFKKPTETSNDPSDSENENEEEEEEEEVDSEKEEADLIRQQVEEGNEEFDQVALRKYEIEKMKYYFAVVECDSVATAQTIYNTCDGTEYEASANFFDMRFIPDDMDFDEDTPKDEATHIPEKYEPRDFSSQALQHSRVKLTWDADEPDRTKLTRRAFTQEEIDNMDFGDLLASSSSDDSSDEDGEDKLAQKRALLLAGPDKDSDESDDENAGSDNEKMGDMEITFTPGLSEAAAARMEEKKKAEEEAEDRANETTIERFRRLKKERREKWRESVKEKKAAIATNGKHKKGSRHGNDDDNLISDNEDEFRARTAGDSFFTYSDEDDEFENATSSRPDNKKTRETKSERKQRREREDKEKAELELLLDGADSGRQHFDINEIIKAEKKKKGKGKGKKKGAEPDVQDDFKLDTSDPRFSALFESHNFAIDPNNPNFKKTKAMKDLLNESRRKRYRMSK